MQNYIKKGDKITAKVIKSKDYGTYSIAGIQDKIVVTEEIINGIITHIRGNDPINPTSIGIWILKDDGNEVVYDLKDLFIM